MKTRVATGAMILLTLCFSAWMLQANTQTGSAPKQWEYKFDYQCNEKKANAYGVEGWELVATDPSGSGSGASSSGFMFKRPKR